MIFWQKLEREGVTKHIVKNKSTLFCIIYYSILPNQGSLCLSVCTPDPQKVIRIIENVCFDPAFIYLIIHQTTNNDFQMVKFFTLITGTKPPYIWKGGNPWIIALQINIDCTVCFSQNSSDQGFSYVACVLKNTKCG